VNADDLKNRFDFHPAKDNRTQERHSLVRSYCLALATSIDSLVPEGREKALAITKLEEVMMWANAGIAREGE
jgi:hypothetical protein